MPLQKLVGNIYSVVVEILLWLVPIVGVIAGVIGAQYAYRSNPALLGLLGLIAGLVLDVVLFGPVIILLNIRSSLKNIENK